MSPSRRTRSIATPAGEVSAVFDGPKDADALLVLAPGAGADIHSDFMSFFADCMGGHGVRVCRFNFRYLELGRKAPDRQPILEETYAAVAEHLAGEPAGRLFLGGKSMGGRIASHVAAAGTICDGLVFLGYPLHPPGRPDRLRDAHLHDVKVPMLFVEGTRDPFCPLETLERVAAELPVPPEVAVIEGGDHSLKVAKSSGRTTQDAWTEACSHVAAWITSLNP
ncbi:MAG: alpha/beta hydrolase family protein [Actinomycetota bacterium]